MFYNCHSPSQAKIPAKANIGLSLNPVMHQSELVSKSKVNAENKRMSFFTCCYEISLSPSEIPKGLTSHGLLAVRGAE